MSVDRHTRVMGTRVTAAPRLAALMRTAVLGAVLLLLAGCLQVKAGLQVNTDDTVSGQLTIFATKAELTSGGRSQEQGFADYRKQLPPLPAGQEAPFDDGTNYGVIVSYDHTPLSKFNGNIKIVRTGNQVVFTIGLDPAMIAAQVPNGDANSTKAYLTLTAFEITVTLPGNIVSAQTNGTVIGQNTVAWTIAANAAKPAELKAVSQVPATGGPAPTTKSSHTLLFVILGVGLVLLLAVAGVLVWAVLRRRAAGRKPDPTATRPTVPTG